ncbi:MAG: DUF4139 domain-containing protein [Gemmataceae bacterium]|nr:DUF4139 domain-containing protein [Gemmataceae bacterium]
MKVKKKVWWCLPLAAVSALAGVLAWWPKGTWAEPKNDDVSSVAPPRAALPIKTVVLFSSGVGYFERRGSVDGDARVDLTFQVRDINDLIKSMVIRDEKGMVASISYDSFEPVERTLKSFAVNLTGNPTFGQILTQLRGEKVEVVLNPTVTTQPGTITGSVLGIETQRQAVKEGPPVETEFLNLWCAEGVRSIKLSEVQRLRFLNPVMESEFRRALDTLALSHDAQKKAVSLTFTGEGKREVRVGYVVENPIWKTSYRLVLDKGGKPFLQGWAVVDNPTDDDWDKVGMALISGRPVSFQMDMYQPLYVPRPVVELELFQSLRPVAYDSGRMLGRPAEAAAAMSAAPAPPGVAGGFGGGGPGAPAGAMPDAMMKRRAGADRKAEMQRGEALARELENRMNLAQGVQSAATASQLGDFFQYVIDHPVTLPRQKSALLPIINKEIDATRLSIYNPSVHPKFPMLGLKLKNSSGLHLMQGPITVFEGNVYAGDAQIKDLAPNDERLISYAVDLGTEVEAKSERKPDRLVAVRIEHGLLIQTVKVREEKTYTAINRNGQPRTLWIEHPYRPEFKIVSDTKPVERTADVYRFEMKLPEAKDPIRQTIVEEQDLSSTIALTNVDDGTIRFFINNAVTSPQVKAALQQLQQLKAKLATTTQELSHVNEQLRVITEDQARLRANLKEMPTNAAAYKRYLEKFDKQETEIESLREAQKRLQQQQLKDQQEVDAYLRNLNVN